MYTQDELSELIAFLRDRGRNAHKARATQRHHRLALEAFRRGEVSRAKLLEVAAMVGATAADIERAIRHLDLDDDGVDVLTPER